MANITLPSNPVNGQTVVIGTRLFQYDSTAGRWKSRVFRVLGDTSVTVTNEAPTISASLSEIALDTSGANVSFTYTVSDVDSSVLKVSHSVSGIANSDLATVTHHRANNTVTITAGTEAFSNGQITLTVTDGRNNATDTVDVSTAYIDWSNTSFQQKLLASNAGGTDYFGDALSIDGDTIIVGAPREDTGASTSGSAYVFTRSGSTWTEQQKIDHPEPETGDQFGFSVAISGDTVVVGAPYHDIPSGGAGAAYIFTRSGSTWTQQQKIQSSDIEGGDDFGYSVAISGDTVIVGAFDESSAGAAYIFTRTGSTWTQQQKITASDIQSNDDYGISVSIDGDTVIVGSWWEDTTASGAGSAYIYTRSGSTWTEQQKIQASDAEENGYFGYSVAISGDTVIVGAYLAKYLGDFAGAAYIYTRSGSTWTEQQKIRSSDIQDSDQFGWSVAIEGDTAIVGAPAEDTNEISAGAAYIFTRSGSTWTEQKKIQPTDVVSQDRFGRKVRISGNTVVGGRIDGTGKADVYIAG